MLSHQLDLRERYHQNKASLDCEAGNVAWTSGQDLLVLSWQEATRNSTTKNVSLNAELWMHRKLFHAGMTKVKWILLRWDSRSTNRVLPKYNIVPAVLISNSVGAAARPVWSGETVNLLDLEEVALVSLALLRSSLSKAFQLSAELSLKYRSIRLNLSSILAMYLLSFFWPLFRGCVLKVQSWFSRVQCAQGRPSHLT